MSGYRLARQFRVFCENYAKAVSIFINIATATEIVT